MATKTEGQVLAETFAQARNLTLWFMSKLKDVDPYHSFEVSGIKLNCPYWIYAHVTSIENWLMLKSTGGEHFDIPWLLEFSVGKTMPNDTSNLLSVKEVIDTMKMVHERSIEYVSTLDTKELDEENLIGGSFGGDKSKRMMVQHAIRHEANHGGHLSWLCKLHGIKTI